MYTLEKKIGQIAQGLTQLCIINGNIVTYNSLFFWENANHLVITTTHPLKASPPPAATHHRLENRNEPPAPLQPCPPQPGAAVRARPRGRKKTRKKGKETIRCSLERFHSIHFRLHHRLPSLRVSHNHGYRYDAADTTENTANLTPILSDLKKKTRLLPEHNCFHSTPRP